MNMDTIVSLAKRRGFIFQSSEIYGGTGSCWDYGPLGVELKNNVKRVWWRDNVHLRPDVVGLDASILMHPTVWKASGHVDHFTDPMVDCRACKRRFRADQLDGGPWVHYCPAKANNKFDVPGGEPCKHCGSRRTLCHECGKGELTAPRQFNLMFKTFMGPVEEDAAVTYLRPETAQGIFVNFDNVLQAMRLKLPFGIAQIGKSFRNEITPGNFIFRTREFEQMEIEYFVNPRDSVDRRTSTGTSAGSRTGWPGTGATASGPTTCGCASMAGMSCPTTPSGRPMSSTASPWAGVSWRASPTGPTST